MRFDPSEFLDSDLLETVLGWTTVVLGAFLVVLVVVLVVGLFVLILSTAFGTTEPACVIVDGLEYCR